MVPPSIKRATACIFTTSLPLGPGRRFGARPMMIHGRFLMNHRKRDEFGKPAGLVLDIPKQIHVFDPVDGRFQMTVHDGRSGGEFQDYGRW